MSSLTLVTKSILAVLLCGVLQQNIFCGEKKGMVAITSLLALRRLNTTPPFVPLLSQQEGTANAPEALGQGAPSSVARVVSRSTAEQVAVVQPRLQDTDKKKNEEVRFLRFVACNKYPGLHGPKGSIRINEGPISHKNNYDGTRTFWGMWTKGSLQGLQCTKHDRDPKQYALQERYSGLNPHIHVLDARTLTDDRVVLDVKLTASCRLIKEAFVPFFTVITADRKAYRFLSLANVLEVTRTPDGNEHLVDITQKLADESLRSRL